MESIEIIKVFGMSPANDNAGPAQIPVLTALLARHDLTLQDVLVYGAIASLDGVPMRAGKLAALLRMHERTLSASLTKLCGVGLLERRQRGRRGSLPVYAAIGPRAA